MKISKKTVAASTELVEEGAVPSIETPAASAESELDAMVLKDAKSYINSAIKSLGAYARRTGDPKAKEAIANLGVVLLDLQ